MYLFVASSHVCSQLANYYYIVKKNILFTLSGNPVHENWGLYDIYASIGNFSALLISRKGEDI